MRLCRVGEWSQDDTDKLCAEMNTFATMHCFHHKRIWSVPVLQSMELTITMYMPTETIETLLRKPTSPIAHDGVRWITLASNVLLQYVGSQAITPSGVDVHMVRSPRAYFPGAKHTPYDPMPDIDSITAKYNMRAHVNIHSSHNMTIQYAYLPKEIDNMKKLIMDTYPGTVIISLHVAINMQNHPAVQEVDRMLNAHHLVCNGDTYRQHRCVGQYITISGPMISMCANTPVDPKERYGPYYDGWRIGNRQLEILMWLLWRRDPFCTFPRDIMKLITALVLYNDAKNVLEVIFSTKIPTYGDM